MEKNITDRMMGRSSRRTFLAIGFAVGATALAGCMGGNDDGENNNEGGSGLSLERFRGSGPYNDNRPEINAPRIKDLPDLSGDLSIYLGGGEGGLYETLLELLGEEYPDFKPVVKSNPSANVANTLIQEHEAGDTRADVFWSIDAGSLSIVAKAGATTKLPKEVTTDVPKSFHPTEQWVGTAGRARAIAYNTEQFSGDDIPTEISAFPETEAFTDSIGWAPTYGAFQAFVTAMRVLEGEEKTKQWLTGMQNQGVKKYPNEFVGANAIADGELGVSFANHYYALRVKAERPDAPLDLAFTSGDAGALVNTAGAEILKGTEREELAQNFIRHLLSAEVQEFFATRTFGYPMVTGVPPVGDLPPIEELEPPELDLSKLSDLEPTLKLMREVGVL